MAQHIVQGPEQSDKPELRFGAVMGGREFAMKLTWLPCQEFWDLEMVAPSGEQLLAGIRVVANLDMLNPYSDDRMPPGMLICHDTENLQQNPGRNDWRERHRLVYVDPVEPEPGIDIRIERAPVLV